MGTSQSRQAVDDGAGSESAQTPAVEGASGGDVAGQPPQQANRPAAPNLKNEGSASAQSAVQVPPELRCCITQAIMTDPVLAMDGHVYERKAIQQWLKRSDRSPLTNEPLQNKTLVPCHPIKAMIAAYHQKNGTEPDAASETGSRRSSSSSLSQPQLQSSSSQPPRLQRAESLSRRAMLTGNPPPVPGARNLGSGLNRHFGGSSRHLVVPVFERDPLPDVPPEDALPEGGGERQDAPLAATAEEDEGGAVLRMELAAERSSVRGDAEWELASMVTLKAVGNDARDRRPGLDLVAVVDSSGSMHGEKMALLCQTLKFLGSHMRSSDRLSIVAFNHRPSVVTPLRRMDAAGRAATELAVDSSPKLFAGGGTDLAGGVLLGCKVLRQRARANAVSSLLLLTDGQDDDALTLCGDGPNAIGQHLPTGCTIHTFGYGADHDANVLCKLAEAEVGGTFTFVEENAGLESAFACCLGGLLSVVAHRIRLKVGTRGWVPPGAAAPAGGEGGVVAFNRCLSQVSSSRGYRGAPGDWDGVEIDVGNMYQGERKDILVSVQLPAWPTTDTNAAQCPVLEAECSYFVADGGQGFANAPRSIAAQTLSVRREAGPDTDAEAGRNLELDEQRNRVLASEALAAAVSLTSDRRKEQGVASLDAAIATIQASWSAQGRLSSQSTNADASNIEAAHMLASHCRRSDSKHGTLEWLKELVEELEEAKRRLGGQGASVHGTPAAGGEAFVRSLSLMHRHQRSASFRLSHYTTQEQGRLMGNAAQQGPAGGQAPGLQEESEGDA